MIWRHYYRKWVQVWCSACQVKRTGCSLSKIFFEHPPRIEESQRVQAVEGQSHTTVSAPPMRKSVSEGTKLKVPIATRSSTRTVPSSPQPTHSTLESIDRYHQILEGKNSSEFLLRESHANLRGAWKQEQVVREVLDARYEAWEQLDAMYRLRLDGDRNFEEEQPVAGPSQPWESASPVGRSPGKRGEPPTTGSAGDTSEEEVVVRRPKKRTTAHSGKEKGRATYDDDEV